MKKNNFGIVCLSVLFSTPISFAQQSVHAAGGDASGSGGTVAYSIGQPFYGFNGSSFTSNEGVQQPFEITVGVDEIEQLNLSMAVFPNPAYDLVRLRIDEFDQYSLSARMIDATGRVIASESIETEETSFTVQELPVGTYYLEVFLEENRFKTFTIIKH